MTDSAKLIEGIESYSPENPDHEALAKQVGGNRSFGATTKFYDDAMTAYNQIPINGIVLLPAGGRSQTSNTIKILENRGLYRDTDYRIDRISRDSKGMMYPAGCKPLRLTKLTKTLGRVLEG